MYWYARHSTVPALSCPPHTPHSSHALAVLAGLKLGLQQLHAVALNMLNLSSSVRACSLTAGRLLLAPRVGRPSLSTNRCPWWGGR